jgi:hypothetical protein
MATKEEIMQAARQRALHDVNAILAKMLPRQARFRYFALRYRDPKSGETRIDKRYVFGWSTERVGEERKFYAFIYRITKKGSCWKIIRKVSFGKRRVAKARAHKWHDQYQEKIQKKLAIQNNGDRQGGI